MYIYEMFKCHGDCQVSEAEGHCSRINVTYR